MACAIAFAAWPVGLQAQDAAAATPDAQPSADTKVDAPADGSAAPQSQDGATGAPTGSAASGTSTGPSSGTASAATAGAASEMNSGAAGTEAGPAPQQTGQAEAKKSKSAASSNSTYGSDGIEEKGGNVHTLANNVSIALSQNWAEATVTELPPPAELKNYAPGFHLTSILSLQNLKSASILQLAMSDNPLIGHDSNWLDEQMHKPAGSGMSVLDLMFYYFFPPSQQCMAEAQNSVVTAKFAPSPAIESAEATGATPPSTDGTNPELQLTYHCHHEQNLDGFFAAQLSNGITFVQTNTGPRAYAVVPQFYLAPMERVQAPGITWFVFEAQRTDPVNAGARSHYRLGVALEGAQADYFWAIGAPDPFPWSADGSASSERLIHAAYASVGLNNNRRAAFINLLQRIQVRGANPSGQ